MASVEQIPNGVSSNEKENSSNQNSPSNWHRPIRLGLISLIFIIAFISVFAWRNSSVDNYYIILRNLKLKLPWSQQENSNRTRIILAYTKWFGEPLNKIWDLSPCPNLNCRLSVHHSDLRSADAILFHIRDFNLEQAPTGLGRWQRSVFFLNEAPPHTFSNLNLLRKGFRFNWTMTYRTDSDIFSPYGEIEMLPWNVTEGFEEDLEEIWSKKTKMVLWMASGCPTTSRRELIVKALRNHIDVDIWGACGNPKACPRSAEPNCTEHLSSDYKFYLAFENAICDDYVSEKFWRRWQLNTVPVVLKRKLLERVLPAELRGEKVFIAVDDFLTVEGLAERLKYLAKNKTEYFKYFKWKSRVKTVFSPTFFVCRVCEKLLKSGDEVKWYPDIKKWWETGSHCEKDTVMSRVRKYNRDHPSKRIKT